MKCEFCSEEITSGALACPRCGNPVSKATGQAPVQSVELPAEDRLPDPPLARLEEDFIALAEESVTFDRNGQPAAEVAAIADQVVPPGAHVIPERIELDNSLIGGYKGPEASSVAGAGEQTADDPFGLNITDITENSAPRREWQSMATSWRYSKWWNITVMIFGIIVLLFGIAIGAYFTFMKKAGSGGGSPAEVVQQYVRAAISDNQESVARLSAPGSVLKDNIATLLKGYELQGLIYFKDFSARIVKASESSATVQIEKFDISYDTEKSDREIVHVLRITEPFKLNTTIELIRQNDQWLVKT
ncbi:MAG: hypothetical protein CVT63_03035 [Candidatus Anoxymicrobium japonicum]|uniref:Uncharacterized protein n=1 Tax=Candidatus Anoxymicrobium japonicum TaxID=2013648 RepID=A0A2N3G6Y9_9ACTN|nr:MAG: hypothetical protein CVT63_03035 [Candidatus Anoxymicrobium japonicum]